MIDHMGALTKKISQLKEDIHRSHLKISLAIVLVLKTDDKLYSKRCFVVKCCRDTSCKKVKCRKVSEFVVGRIVAYLDCELSYSSIAARVGRNPLTNRCFLNGHKERRTGYQRLAITNSRGDRHVTAWP
ncbi:hypothetical protein LAZ67_X004485 [Cordylochernes scorpioides]|uniref:Transposase n=1 Tax=Cordylochernes scorpioides TaxID=51811 RepID=A0ABY6LVZ8_9ARAC|nr:hypothetical protein LAZ67_X004485 [Cordylochernes scorpioides]